MELPNLVREFQGRAAKRLVEGARNMRELLPVPPGAEAARLDFTRIRLLDTATILPDFRERRDGLVSDLPGRPTEKEEVPRTFPRRPRCSVPG